MIILLTKIALTTTVCFLCMIFSMVIIDAFPRLKKNWVCCLMVFLTFILAVISILCFLVIIFMWIWLL